MSVAALPSTYVQAPAAASTESQPLPMFGAIAAPGVGYFAGSAIAKRGLPTAPIALAWTTSSQTVATRADGTSITQGEIDAAMADGSYDPYFGMIDHEAWND